MGGLADLPAYGQARIEIVDGHWLWTGSTNGGGYGVVNGPSGGPHPLAHRWVWEQLGGGAAPHLHHDGCPHKNCTRPACLTPMGAVEHKLHHEAEVRREACSAGHLFTPENTYWRNGRNGRKSRQCRRCKADRENARRAAMAPEQAEAKARADAERRRDRNGWAKREGSRY